MKAFKKVIFVDNHGTLRAPMAEAIFSDLIADDRIEICSRGLIVLFPEPLNQKAEAVLASNGLYLKNYLSHKLAIEDLTEDTLVIVMEREQREKLLTMFPDTENVEVLTELTGDELEIMNPYGAPLPSYGLCFETLSIILKKLNVLMNEGEEECQSYT